MTQVVVAKTNPHDPGVEVAGRRAEEAGDVARSPIKGGKGGGRFGHPRWKDPATTVPGVFYPKGISTAEERLRFYASQFPVVEVDATYYVLPNKRTAESWVERTPGDFVFNIKAPGLRADHPTGWARLPKAIREELHGELAEKKRIYRKDVPADLL